MKKDTKKSSAGEKCPPANCAHTKLEDPRALKINPKNPNRHGPEQLRVYAKILRHQGWRKPIVVSNLSGMVVTGAGATLCAIAEGWAKVPVDYQDFASPADEYAHMIADNRLPQMSDMDEELVREILRDEIGSNLDHELAALVEDAPTPTELKPVTIQQPPKMAWVLIGIPVVRYGEISETMEKLGKLQDVFIESTVNDQLSA